VENLVSLPVLEVSSMHNKTSIVLVALAAGVVGFLVGKLDKTHRSATTGKVMTRTMESGEESAVFSEAQTIARPSHAPVMVAERTSRFVD